jgi:hypothetical protein
MGISWQKKHFLNPGGFIRVCINLGKVENRHESKLTLVELTQLAGHRCPVVQPLRVLP